VKKVGVEEAKIIARFQNKHVDTLLRLVEMYHLNCDMMERETVDAYFDLERFEQAKEEVHEISRHVEELDHKIYSGKQAQDQFRLSKGCIGAIVTRAAQIWSYKFVTQIVEKLVDEGINLQTETPVTNISPGDQGKWIVETTRGNIITSHVIHATNGYVQSLLPKFSSITATRGFMTAQIPPKSLSHPPLDHTYCFIYERGGYDYLIQLPIEYGSKLMMGGGMVQDPNPKSSDDGDVPAALEHYLRDQLPNVLHWEGEDCSDDRLDMAWSGIMGFSRDSCPWVGALPQSVGGGAGQWICAGYTGEGIEYNDHANLGMINAPLCAEALAMMLLGKQLPADFPRSYLVTEERIQNTRL
jgi:glycine/D-amino acid oxidase-like deaminating enzyme